MLVDCVPQFEAQFMNSPNLSRLLVDAYILRCGDFCAQNDDDNTTDYFTPCASMRGKNAVLILHNTCTYNNKTLDNSNITMSRMRITYNVHVCKTVYNNIILLCTFCALCIIIVP